jgi:hypothetical protein
MEPRTERSATPYNARRLLAVLLLAAGLLTVLILWLGEPRVASADGTTVSSQYGASGSAPTGNLSCSGTVPLVLNSPDNTSQRP